MAVFELLGQVSSGEGDAADGGAGVGVLDVELEVVGAGADGLGLSRIYEVLDEEERRGVGGAMRLHLLEDAEESVGDLAEVEDGIVLRFGLELLGAEVGLAVGVERFSEMGQLAFVEGHSGGVFVSTELNEVLFAGVEGFVEIEIGHRTCGTGQVVAAFC